MSTSEAPASTLEREYNPRIQVPEFASYFARWRDLAGEARRLAAIASRGNANPLARAVNLPYGPTPIERLDLFSAAGPANPLLIFVHGGYWRALDKDDFSWIAPPYVAAGISVAVVNYGLLPATPLQRIVEQVRRACGWLYHNAARLGIDRERMVCSGHSAGGHLTAMMLATDWPGVWSELPPRLLRGAVAVSGLFDLEPLTRAQFLRDDLKLDPVRARALSPAFLPWRNEAPLLRAVGAGESAEFHRQSALPGEHWPQACRSPLLEVPEANHFSVCDQFADPQSRLFRATVELLLG